MLKSNPSPITVSHVAKIIIETDGCIKPNVITVIVFVAITSAELTP